MKKCPRCGRENPDYLERCVDCGTALGGGSRALPKAVLVAGLTVVAFGLISVALLWRRPFGAGASTGGSATATAAPASTAAAYAPFRTAGIPEAHGIDITFNYPAAWVPMKMAGGVCGFRNPASSDADFVGLSVVNPGRPLTDALFLQQLEQSEVIKGLESGGIHRRKDLVQRASFPCVSLDYDLAGKNGRDGHVREYVLEIDGKVVEMTFARIGGAAEPSPARAQMMDEMARSIRKN